MRGQGLARSFCRLGQIGSFERRLRGAAAPSPLALPYPFRTWPGTGVGAERDKQKVRKKMYCERYSLVIIRIFMYGEVDKNKTWENIISKLASYFVLKQRLFT